MTTNAILAILLLLSVLAGCALPAGSWSITIPSAQDALNGQATPWVGGPPQATAEAVYYATATAQAIQTVEAPQLNTTPEPPACLIKGNISAQGERIYHLTGQANYGQVKIDLARGERWFCSEAEAEAAGWRKAGN